MRGWKLFPLALALLSLAGCAQLPDAREMGDMALLRTMGVDWAEDGVEVTVSTGPRAKGLQGEREEALVLSARSASLSGAALALQSLSDSYVFFGYVDQLLLGEEQARRGTEGVLDYFSRDNELGPGARTWVIRGDTAAAAASSGGGQGVDSRLETLRTDGEMGVASISRTAGEVFADLLEWGCAYLPALAVGQGEQAALTDSGYAVLKDGALAGFLDGEAARGLELLAGRPGGEILTAALPSGPVTARVTGAETRCAFRGPAGEERLEITCRVTARPVEFSAPLAQSDLRQLEELLRPQEERRLGAALDRLRAWQTDCTGLGPRAGLTAPGLWQSLRPDWPARFAACPVRLSVEIAVQGQ